MVSVNSRAPSRSPARRACARAAASRPWSDRKSGSGSPSPHQPALPPVPYRSHSGNAVCNGAGFWNFSHDTWAWIAPPAMAGNTTVVVLRFPSRDSRPSLTSHRRQKQEKWLPPFQKKNRLVWSWLDLIMMSFSGPTDATILKFKAAKSPFDKNQE